MNLLKWPLKNTLPASGPELGILTQIWCLSFTSLNLEPAFQNQCCLQSDNWLSQWIKNRSDWQFEGKWGTSLLSCRIWAHVTTVTPSKNLKTGNTSYFLHCNMGEKRSNASASTLYNKFCSCWQFCRVWTFYQLFSNLVFDLMKNAEDKFAW